MDLGKHSIKPLKHKLSCTRILDCFSYSALQIIGELLKDCSYLEFLHFCMFSAILQNVK